jgi:hypothetical protein
MPVPGSVQTHWSGGVAVEVGSSKMNLFGFTVVPAGWVGRPHTTLAASNTAGVVRGAMAPARYVRAVHWVMDWAWAALAMSMNPAAMSSFLNILDLDETNYRNPGLGGLEL